jgi:hypothetical protein
MRNEAMRRILWAATVGALLVTAQAGTERSVQAADVQGHVLPAYTTHTYTRYFQAGETITVLVSGIGITDLDLYVWSPAALLGADEDGSDDCVVRRTAPLSGSYRIQVVNRGGAPNIYTILID